MAGVEKLTLLSADLPAGVYDYTYYITARVPGRYGVLPPWAQAPDVPETFSHGAGSSFTVLP